MAIVKNSFGVEINFDYVVGLMDDDVREAVHNDIAPCSEQEFFDAYCKAHLSAFGTEWELDKRNPQY